MDALTPPSDYSTWPQEKKNDRWAKGTAEYRAKNRATAEVIPIEPKRAKKAAKDARADAVALPQHAQWAEISPDMRWRWIEISHSRMAISDLERLISVAPKKQRLTLTRSPARAPAAISSAD